MKCQNCGNNFAGRSDAKFCCSKCRSSHHNKTKFHSVIPGNKDIIKEHIDAIVKNRDIVASIIENEQKPIFQIPLLIMMGVKMKYYSKVESFNNTTTYHFFDYSITRYGDSNAVDLNKGS